MSSAAAPDAVSLEDLTAELELQHIRIHASSIRIVKLCKLIAAASQATSANAQPLQTIAQLIQPPQLHAAGQASPSSPATPGATPRSDSPHSARRAAHASATPHAHARGVLGRLGSPEKHTYLGHDIECAAAALDARMREASVHMAKSSAASPDAVPPLSLDAFAPPFNAGQPGQELQAVWQALCAAGPQGITCDAFPGMSSGKAGVLLGVLASRELACSDDSGCWYASPSAST